MARVFIGIPTWNRPILVQETVKSLQAQTYDDWVAIVSDNNSSPENVSVTKKFVTDLNDPRISFYQQEKNNGEYGQGWFFFNHCKSSDYLMILHDDDVLKKDYLKQAVERLDSNEHVSVFLADPYIFDQHGCRSKENTRWYLNYHHREKALEGEFDILEKIMCEGFCAISGTVYRTTSLIESGFADQGIVGNFPFEFNLFLRLGDLRKKGWYQKEELLGFRFHPGALRKTDEVIRSYKIVTTMIGLLEKRRYRGRIERRRKVILCRLYRALTEIAINSKKYTIAKDYLKKGLRYNPISIKALMIAPALWCFPLILPYVLPKKDIAVPPEME